MHSRIFFSATNKSYMQYIQLLHSGVFDGIIWNIQDIVNLKGLEYAAVL